MLYDEIQEYPYHGGVMDKTRQTDNEGRVLQTSSYVVSMPLTQDSEGNYIIPIKGDSIELIRYGQTILLEVNNAEPSQLQGISVYCTRNKW